LARTPENTAAPDTIDALTPHATALSMADDPLFSAQHVFVVAGICIVFAVTGICVVFVVAEDCVLFVDVSVVVVPLIDGDAVTLLAPIVLPISM